MVFLKTLIKSQPVHSNTSSNAQLLNFGIIHGNRDEYSGKGVLRFRDVGDSNSNRPSDGNRFTNGLNQLDIIATDIVQDFIYF